LTCIKLGDALGLLRWAMMISDRADAAAPSKPLPLHCLLAVDGSAQSLHAAHWLAGLTQTGLALRCTILAVQRPVLAGEISAIAPAHITAAAREQEAQAALDQASAVFEAAGVEYHTLSCIGDAAPTVLDRARVYEADAIVMGRRGWGALKSALLGSVSAEVIQGASMPVVIVGENTPLTSPPLVGKQRPLSLLLALDHFPNALRAADFAAQLTLRAGGPLHALHVQPSLTLAEALFSPRQHLLDHWAGHEGEQSLAAPRALLHSKGIAITEHAASSDAPDEAICRLAAELPADLVVMGTRGLNPLSATLMGSVTQGVLAQTRQAVALVP
jgi:nucleotide-binding universal stress UspA family protein